ncbi:hypothetical protein CHARACLAT_018268 [Characodon lateralis]|uniref:Uncharacterized protein n=1 Tax=Characodon lateralis TaxID=208331 RepID=A0ABU7DLJ8_9TELE|nr:hypothetical protein [Characodon lateralis]
MTTSQRIKQEAELGVSGWLLSSSLSSWLLRSCWSPLTRFMTPTTGRSLWFCGMEWVIAAATRSAWAPLRR